MDVFPVCVSPTRTILYCRSDAASSSESDILLNTINCLETLYIRTAMIDY